ncbi:MAG TPA: PP2C family protein-serine/threonine phosphatase [Ignavibacteriaceae bacterium]
MIYSILNTAEHKLSYCNAGHNNPYLFPSDKEPVRLSEGGIVVGMIPDYNYVEDLVEFRQGEVFVLYSDGVTEAMNFLEEEFGEERLEKSIRKNMHLSAEEMIKETFRDVESFTRGAPQSDDITMVIVKRVK